MVKFVLEGTDGVITGLGLSRENIKRLVDGKPILFNTSELGLPPVGVLIFFGETEEEMKKELTQSGFIGPKTIVKEQL